MIRPDPDMPVFGIGVVARLLGLHEQTLRLYERKGLVEPKRISRQMRLYSQHDLERLEYVCFLTHEMGVTAQGVRLLLERVGDPARELLKLEQEFRKRERGKKRGRKPKNQSPEDQGNSA
jgi:MerR family transcriptional regulator, heat shock protein HspR